MPSHTAMWFTAGGAALLSAALTYAATRSVSLPEAARGLGARWSQVARASWRQSRDGCETRSCESRAFDTSAGGTAAAHATSGNRAFDEYRAETLKRLDEEALAFQDFLARLRHAKDRAEFDQFMAERRDQTAAETK